jgi:hypothetical protein
MHDKYSQGGLFSPQQYIPYSKKKANNFKWLEEVADYYEYFETDGEFVKKNRKYKLNYDMYNGRADMGRYIQECSPFEQHMLNYSEDNDYSKIRHHPVIDTVAKSIVGEQRRRPLNAVIFNSNVEGINKRRRKKQELLNQYMQKSILDPIRNKITQQYMLQNDIEDPYTMDKESQDKMRSEIDQQVTQENPKEILAYMRKGFKTPEDKQLTKIYEYLKKREDIKFKCDQGFEHGIITGLEAYYTPIQNNEPKLYVINPMNLKYYLSADRTFIDDAEWVTYKKSMTYSEIFNDYNLDSEDIKKLNNLNFMSGSSGGAYEQMKHKRDSRMISVVGDRADHIDPKSNQGQQDLMALYEKYGTDHVNAVDVVHTVIRSVRKLFVTKRYDKEIDRLVTYYWDESYKRHPDDVEFTSRMVPELYQVTKIGEGGTDCLYVQKGPVPYQYRDLSNPFDVKMPYTGAEYSRLMNNTENVSLMDLGAPWQFRLNVEMARLDESLATDIGNVMVTNMASIPKNWDLDKYYSYMRYKKIVPVDFSQEGIGPNDAQLFKSIDLSNGKQIQERINLIEYLRNQISLSMSYNPSRLGLIDQYTAVSNNQQNIIQSSLQTESIYAMHNKIVEKMLNSLMNTARVAYKDNPIKASYILDDLSIADLNLDSEMMWRSEIGLFISNESEDIENLRATKEFLQPMIQNQVIGGPEAIKLLWARSGAECLEIAESATEKMIARQQQDQEFQKQMMQQQAKIQEQLAKQAQDFDLMKQANDLAQKDRAAEMQSFQFANQYDINKNQINDGNEKADKDRLFERDENQKDRDQELKITDKKLVVEKIKANKSSKTL